MSNVDIIIKELNVYIKNFYFKDYTNTSNYANYFNNSNVNHNIDELINYNNYLDSLNTNFYWLNSSTGNYSFIFSNIFYLLFIIFLNLLNFYFRIDIGYLENSVLFNYFLCRYYYSLYRLNLIDSLFYYKVISFYKSGDLGRSKYTFESNLNFFLDLLDYLINYIYICSFFEVILISFIFAYLFYIIFNKTIIPYLFIFISKIGKIFVYYVLKFFKKLDFLLSFKIYTMFILFLIYYNTNYISIISFILYLICLLLLFAYMCIIINLYYFYINKNNINFNIIRLFFFQLYKDFNGLSKIIIYVLFLIIFYIISIVGISYYLDNLYYSSSFMIFITKFYNNILNINCIYICLPVWLFIKLVIFFYFFKLKLNSILFFYFFYNILNFLLIFYILFLVADLFTSKILTIL